MELKKDEQITLNIDGFIISQNIHNTNTAQSLFGIKNKNNLSIGHDDRTWVLEQDIICDTCNKCVSCQTCNSCNGCVSTVGCNDKCQGCTGSCTGCASGCYESCFGDCYSCQDCQAGCTSCNSCTAGCDGGCQTECYACVNCDICVGCNLVVCRGNIIYHPDEHDFSKKCLNCTTCAGCFSNCNGHCVGCVGCDNKNDCTGCFIGCNSACQTSCNACVGCTGGCQGSCQVCVGCTGGCQGGCQTGCQTGCTGCTSCTGCNGCNGTCTGTVCGNNTNQCGNNTNQCGNNTNQCGSKTGPDPGDDPGDNPGYKKKTWKTYCIGTNTGGYNAGINNSCTGGGDDGAHSDCPPEWVEEGHTEDEWNALDYDSQKDFALEHNYEEENHDPPSDFVSPSLDDIIAQNPELEGKEIEVKTDCDPETGKITQTIVDKNTGETLLTSEVKEDGSFDYQRPDGSTALEDVKIDDNGDIDSGKGHGEDGKETDLSDGSTTMNDPNSGKEVSIPPQGAGC